MENAGQAGLEACGRTIDTRALGYAGLLLGCADTLKLNAGTPECGRMIMRQSTRHAIALSRIMLGCLTDSYESGMSAARCPREADEELIRISQRRLRRTIASACGDDPLMSPESGVCVSGLCSASDPPDFSLPGCMRCCVEQGIRIVVDELSFGYPLHCGDGVVVPGEDCDEGLTATCDLDCTIAECGDGKLNPLAGEDCDDGNALGGDGCDPSCRVE